MMFNSDHHISVFLIGFDIPVHLGNLLPGMEPISGGFYRPCSSGVIGNTCAAECQYQLVTQMIYRGKEIMK
jgi:hypothetical protein